MRLKCVQSAFALAICYFLCFRPSYAQQLAFDRPDSQVSSAVELLLEQATQLATGGKPSEALDVLERLQYSQDSVAASNSVVPVGKTQKAGTIAVRRYWPLGERISSDVAQLLQSKDGDVLLRARRLETLSAGALQAVQQSHSSSQAYLNSLRFASSKSHWNHALVEADVCLENGRPMAAIQALQRITPSLRFELDSIDDVGEPAYQPSGGLAWPLVFAASGNSISSYDSDVLKHFADRHLELTLHLSALASDLPSQVAKRYLIAAEMAPQVCELVGTRRWLQFWAGCLPSEQVAHRDDLLRLLNDESMRRNVLASELNSESSFDVSWPVWSESLSSFWSTADQCPASKPRVGELDQASLPYFPCVHKNLVLLHELTRIRAFDLESGNSWPPGNDDGILIESGQDPVAFVPRGYPLVGVPRGALTVSDDIVYARMGSPVTGWATGEASETRRSRSHLVALDLRHQGRMLDAFPVYLDANDFRNGEFEGPPVVWGDLLIVAVAERGNAGLRRSLVAVDRHSGQLVWRSLGLASGIVAGAEQANLIAHQQVCVAGGKIYYNTNLGAIACLDPTTGFINWLAQYSRPDRRRQSIPTPDRYLYRDCTPCFVSGGLVYCAPSDCGEIFALDATSGDLVWSTHHDEVPDAMHWVGVTEDALVVCGDQLVWLDRSTGRMLARYPGANTPGFNNALSAPRGLGRAALSGGKIYFPVEGEILVFDAQVDREREPLVQVPKIARRLNLESRGRQGGNVFVDSRQLIVASPSRLMVFR